jgi:hypothetical protein
MIAPKEAAPVNNIQSHRAPWLPRQSECCNYRSYGTVQSSSYLPYQVKPDEGSPTHTLCHRPLWVKGINDLTLIDSAGTQSNTGTLLYLFGGRETRVFFASKSYWVDMVLRPLPANRDLQLVRLCGESICIYFTASIGMIPHGIWRGAQMLCWMPKSSSPRLLTRLQLTPGLTAGSVTEAELPDGYLRSTAMLSRVKPQSLSSRKSYQTGLSEALTFFTKAQMTWMHDIRNVLQI